ncbi:MAG: magnesium/cobalt transporter CorA [Thermoplasmata archaeon]|nr:magnesium/cobalt transporter CorA [Thermoplasmata archaeon]
MAKIKVIAYSEKDFTEEDDVDLQRCKELIGDNRKTWIDILDLDTETSELLEKLFNIHPLALEDCMDIEQIPKVEEYADQLFIVTRIVDWNQKLATAQISMFLTEKYVITIHHGPVPQLEEVRNRIRKRFPRIIKAGSDYLCFKIIDVIVDSYLPEIEEMEEVLEKYEDDIVAKPTKKTLEHVHDFRDALFTLKKQLTPQRDVVSFLSRGEYPNFKKETRNYLRDVYDHMVTIIDTLDSYRESTSDIQNMYFSSMQLQLNEVMKLLTIIATIVLPLTLIASIYGMNLPIPESAYWISYPLVLFSMLAISILMLYYFKKKNWI